MRLDLARPSDIAYLATVTVLPAFLEHRPQHLEVTQCRAPHCRNSAASPDRTRPYFPSSSVDMSAGGPSRHARSSTDACLTSHNSQVERGVQGPSRPPKAISNVIPAGLDILQCVRSIISWLRKCEITWRWRHPLVTHTDPRPPTFGRGYL